MGSSHWSNDFYNDRAAERARTGAETFAYSKDVAAKPRAEQKVHAKLDPKGVTRESRDSKEHPNAIPIGIMLDVTGSMASIPRQIQAELPKLLDFLVSRKFVTDPQILFGAVGDAISDHAPTQVGQFESGIEMDDDITNLWLEGGGGGSFEESYELALYFFARHTSCDHFEKRAKKGYLFIVGDEMPYPTIRRDIVNRVFGDTLQEDLPIETILKEAQEKFNVYFIIPAGASHGREQRLYDRWHALLGTQNTLTLDSASSIVETVATAIAVGEGRSFGDAVQEMKTAGVGEQTLASVATAFGHAVTGSGVVRL